MNKPRYNNGDEVKCAITGLRGIVVATTVWINGCIRYSVQPQEIKDGRPVDPSHFDENDLKLVKSAKVELTPPRKTGGPQRGESTATQKF